MKPLYSTPIAFKPMKEPTANCPWCEGKGYEWVECGELSGYDYREPCRCVLRRIPYLVGEKCYVREAWDCAPDDIADQLFFPVRYKADDCEPFIAWRSPVTMPQWAARRFVTVLSCEPVRIEDVTEEDCLAVGLKKLSKDNGRTWKFGMADRDGLPGTDNTGWAWQDWCVNPIDAFARLWDSINGKTYPWASNPWVWVTEFRRIPADQGKEKS